ncbi:MAG TPA: glycosyltransferase [Verrucomicrobiae bacterium]|nr:glycosyltransferase [Verrucomicrobiae bacterium]
MSRSALTTVHPKLDRVLQPSGKQPQAPQQSLPTHFPRETSKHLPGVLFRGFIFDGSGYSEETWVEALGVDSAGINIQVEAIGAPHDLRKLLPDGASARLEELIRHRISLNRGVFYMCAPPDMFDRHTSGKYRIGRTMFETDRIPEGWAELCMTMDEIWVPCQFNVETFAGAGVERSRLRVLHPGVDTSIFRPGVQPLALPQTRAFNFLSVFDWHERKGYDVLLRAYLSEFRSDEDVALILKVYQINDPVSDLEAKIAHFIERRANMRLEDSPPIVLVNGFIPQSRMPQLYAAAQAFVLPSRGEGYGRPYMEAMACRLPVIGTRWSGQMEFMSDANSYLVELDGLVEPPADVDMEYYSGHLWAQPSVDDLRAKMRHVVTHREETQARALRGHEQMVSRFSWDAVLPQWVEQFRRLLG